MRKGLTELVFILDRSGSMSGLEKDTIGGFNSMIARQKKERGEAFVTTVLFDDRQEMIHDRVPLKRIRPMNDREYYVRGCTALLDAIGNTISRLVAVRRASRPEDIPEKTIFVITTDGYENSSREYTYDRVKAMVEKEKNIYGWEFLFLGANIDAAKEAGRFGIAPDRAVNYNCDSAGTALNYKVVGSAVSKMRACEGPCMAEAMADWDHEIREDYRKRHNA